MEKSEIATRFRQEMIQIRRRTRSTELQGTNCRLMMASILVHSLHAFKFKRVAVTVAERFQLIIGKLIGLDLGVPPRNPACSP